MRGRVSATSEVGETGDNALAGGRVERGNSVRFVDASGQVSWVRGPLTIFFKFGRTHRRGDRRRLDFESVVKQPWLAANRGRESKQLLCRSIGDGAGTAGSIATLV